MALKWPPRPRTSLPFCSLWLSPSPLSRSWLFLFALASLASVFFSSACSRALSFTFAFYCFNSVSLSLFFLTITSSFICLFLAIDQSSEAANLNMNFTFLPFICFPLNLCLIWFILDSINQFISITPRRILFIFQFHLCPV